MNLTVTPTFAHLTGSPFPVNLLEELDKALRFHPGGYFRDPGYIHHRWDGFEHLMQGDAGGVVFPSGLTTRVFNLFREHQVKVSTIFQGFRPFAVERPECFQKLPDGSELYEDQQEALVASIKGQRGILALATNFGKTRFIAAIAALAPSARIAVLLNDKGLLNQTASTVAGHIREKVGMLGAGRNRIPGTRVTVAMVQTLYHHRAAIDVLEFLAGLDAVIVDESHTITVKTWFPILGRCPASFRIAMSGSVRDVPTLLPMEAFFGPVIAEVRDRELVAQGRSAKPIILMPYVAAATRAEEYADIYEDAIVKGRDHNETIISAVNALILAGLRALILCYRKPHGWFLGAELEKLGLRVRVLDGDSGQTRIDAAKVMFSEHQLDVIVASTIFNKGQDLPAIEVLVNAAAWKSPVATGQKMGRGFRKKLDGENRFILVDPFQLGTRLLKRHSVRREMFYRRRGFEVHKGKLHELLPLALAVGPHGHP